MMIADYDPAEEFRLRKQAAIEEGIELDERELVTLHPHADKQAVLDTIRFAGVFIFLVDWCMKL